MTEKSGRRSSFYPLVVLRERIKSCFWFGPRGFKPLFVPSACSSVAFHPHVLQGNPVLCLFLTIVGLRTAPGAHRSAQPEAPPLA